MKKTWSTPELVVYGTAEEITTQIKNKTTGGSDDVILNGQTILQDASN